MKRYLPLACLSLWRHFITLIDTAVEVTTWGLGILKKFQWGLRLAISRKNLKKIVLEIMSGLDQIMNFLVSQLFIDI